MRMESPLNQRLRRSPPDVVYTPIDVTSRVRRRPRVCAGVEDNGQVSSYHRHCARGSAHLRLGRACRRDLHDLGKLIFLSPGAALSQVHAQTAPWTRQTRARQNETSGPRISSGTVDPGLEGAAPAVCSVVFVAETEEAPYPSTPNVSCYHPPSCTPLLGCLHSSLGCLAA